MDEHWAHNADIHERAYGEDWSKIYWADDVADLARRALPFVQRAILGEWTMDDVDKAKRLAAELEQIAGK